ncbi:hypothetical protein KOR42_06000 [Thalassoglobus neptunius]|uniref:Uncharacterized protein n=1 Tax=Thalassoglobus neptunius TaxID=1938619 RepID=A0A5C5X5E8_9PLAN|nr:hypothetical protein [Thalassoglobus neptunius]TWT57242.1 hypothetical protein KOR42_06000 [Thalassoglobus neptunius]
MTKWVRQYKPLRGAVADPMLDDPGDSDNLERYRGARADLAELDLLERRGELVDVAKINEAWSARIGRLAALAEWLDRRFGVDAGDMAREVFEDLSTEVIDELGGDAE